MEAIEKLSTRLLVNNGMASPTIFVVTLMSNAIISSSFEGLVCLID